jgi:hypothetical protein
MIFKTTFLTDQKFKKLFYKPGHGYIPKISITQYMGETLYDSSFKAKPEHSPEGHYQHKGGKIHIYLYVRMYICMCVYTYIHTHTHTHTNEV